jgi:hypothetical protein
LWLLLKGLKCDIFYEPLGKKGPDYKIVSFGIEWFLEVTNFRGNFEQPENIETLYPLPDLRKRLFDKIEDKLKQLQPGSPNVIWILSSHPWLEPNLILTHAQSFMSESIKNLSAVVVLSTWDPGNRVSIIMNREAPTLPDEVITFFKEVEDYDNI